MVKSTGFRLASILIPTLLLVILGGVVMLALRDNPVTALPTTTRTPITVQTTPEPTATPAEFLISDTPPVRLDGTLRYAEAGIAFGPPQGYRLDLAEQAAILTAEEDSPAAGTILVLRNEDPAAYQETSGELEDVFAAFVRFYAQEDGFALGESSAFTLGGQPARAIDLVGEAAGDFGGRIALSQPTPDQLFVMIGVGPTAIWRSQGLADYMAVLETVTFLNLPADVVADAGDTDAATDADATESTPTAEPTAQPTAQPTATEAATATPVPPTPTEVPTEAPTETPTTNGADLAIPAADTPVPQLPRVTLDPAGWTLQTNGNFVNRLAMREGTLWAATTGGAVAWNLASGNHVKFTTADDLASNHLNTVANCDFADFNDPLGVVFGGDAGLQIYAPETGEWRTLSVASGELAEDAVVDVYCDAQAGYLALLYPRAGVDVYDAATGVWTHLPLDMSTLEAEVGLLRHIVGTSTGDALWIAAQRGLLLIEGDFVGDSASDSAGEMTLVVFTPENSPLLAEGVTAMTPAGDNAIWLASNGAFYRTDGENWDTYTPASSQGEDFPLGRINGLAVAADGTLWVASDQTNICRFDPETTTCVEFFVAESGMVEGPLSSFVLDEQAQPVYGTLGNGIARVSGEVSAGGNWEPLVIPDQPLMGNTVRSLALDAQGNLWIGANRGATQLAAPDFAQPTHYTPATSPLPFADITVIGPGAQGNGVWFGASGAAFFDGDTWSAYTTADSLVDAPIQALTADGVGRTWLGSQGAGISIWTGSNFFNLTAANGLPSEDITALASTGDVVWIGTRGGGLLRFQNNQLRFFSARDSALPSNTITALAILPNGAVLIGTDRGLARYADETLEVITALPADPVTALAVPPAATDAGTADSTTYWIVQNGTALYSYTDGDIFAIEPAALWSPAPISAVLVDGQGALWLGFERGGMVRHLP
ncbi:MAG: two-component regulator propeller domain-containing protein [Litorilinea sp.]